MVSFKEGPNIHIAKNAISIIRVSLTVVPNIFVLNIARWGVREFCIAIIAVNSASLRPSEAPPRTSWLRAGIFIDHQQCSASRFGQARNARNKSSKSATTSFSHQHNTLVSESAESATATATRCSTPHPRELRLSTSTSSGRWATRNSSSRIQTTR